MPLSKKPRKAKLTKSEVGHVRKLVKMPKRSSGVKVVLPDGSTVGLKDLGKVKPTPKPKPKVTPKTVRRTPQDEAMKKILEKKYGKIYG
jgi:hypothetical protein